MKSKEVRQSFFKFFESKGHKIVPSAPLVIKNDPTLMFTNAGMNQFKDYFLGNSEPEFNRIADTQKCLRVSGKHNDLEEVGHDTYHHTMFEMLGNWSFGDYFKKEAIEWAWELLTDIYKIDRNRLYVSVFGGDQEENLPVDIEALEIWKSIVPEEKIIFGSKKDNFWEMGETGPCGPCSEIHVDMRDEKEISGIPGKDLVNKDHPEVIEIWNLVFIQFNRTTDGSLIPLPSKHVDTGMGFERLCRILQNKKSNYDTDVFQPVIHEICKISGLKYPGDKSADTAMRVIADHLRAVAFSIADGQLPSNNKAGYVIRRILRRAVRYGYTYLNMTEPFICKLVPVLGSTLGDVFPEIKAQQKLIEKVIAEEENSFLKTLDTGIKLLDQVVEKSKSGKEEFISGKTAFELYDTFGFPLDLTELILRENGLKVNKREFDTEMKKQKDRSRSAAAQETEDWVILKPNTGQEFTGYDRLEEEVRIVQYRKITSKGKTNYQLVFDKTPFYAESGGQVGDTGYLISENERIPVSDTKKENDLTIHITEKLPAATESVLRAVVEENCRNNIQNNHSATHLLHFALREILGKHVEQKGSLVHPDYLRFDFSHFQKMTREEIDEVEHFVNRLIWKDILLDENRSVSFEDAKKSGAMALFGEKYGDKVRVIRFGDSVELCGGTHVKATGRIGLFRIVSEGAIAAGIRRIEAITGEKAYEDIKKQAQLLATLQEIMNMPQDSILKGVENTLSEIRMLRKEIESIRKEKLDQMKNSLISRAEILEDDIKMIVEEIEIDTTESGKDLVFDINRSENDIIALLGAEIQNKAYLWLMVSDSLVKSRGINAVEIIREISKEIQGGGGGQPFFANAGGKQPQHLRKALDKGREILVSKLK